MTYAYSIVLTPEYSNQVNAVLGPANDDLTAPGTPGQPSTYPYGVIEILNTLGDLGWRFVGRFLAEPHWPNEGDPPVYGFMLEKSS